MQNDLASEHAIVGQLNPFVVLNQFRHGSFLQGFPCPPRWSMKLTDLPVAMRRFRSVIHSGV
jgi:hypothetical protein